MSGCATPHLVEQRQLGDERLSCAQHEAQIADAEPFKEAARDQKGVTGTNAAALLLFWPALIATYSNAGDAIDAADERKEHLRTLHADSGCTESAASATQAQRLNAELKQLSDLHEQGALTDEEFATAKNKLLGQ